VNIPKGYKLVPVEPTVAMEDAAAPECGGYCPCCDDDMQIKTGMQVDIYRAMLAAAPTPPQPIHDEAKERGLFEVWYCSLDENCMPLHRPDGGRYKWDVPEHQWQCWLACAQSRAKDVEVDHE
jgi:hypothetical protein